MVDEGTNIDEYLRLSQGDGSGVDGNGAGADGADAFISLETAAADPEYAIAELGGEDITLGSDGHADEDDDVEALLLHPALANGTGDIEE